MIGDIQDLHIVHIVLRHAPSQQVQAHRDTSETLLSDRLALRMKAGLTIRHS
jgi:hypothetical protein